MCGIRAERVRMFLIRTGPVRMSCGRACVPREAARKSRRVEPMASRRRRGGGEARSPGSGVVLFASLIVGAAARLASRVPPPALGRRGLHAHARAPVRCPGSSRPSGSTRGRRSTTSSPASSSLRSRRRGARDVVVRLLSVAASLLHVPLFLRIGRRSRLAARRASSPRRSFSSSRSPSPRAPRGAATRSRRSSSLAAFERLLALAGDAASGDGGARRPPRRCRGPDALPRAPPRRGNARWRSLRRTRPRRFALLAAGVAAALAAAWLPVALRQPRASMAWARGAAARRAGDAVRREPRPRPSRRARRPRRSSARSRFSSSRRRSSGAGEARVPAASPLVVGLVLLVPLVLFSGSALLPDRTALVFLPFVAFLLAEAPGLLPAAAGPAAAVFLAASLPGWLRRHALRRSSRKRSRRRFVPARASSPPSSGAPSSTTGSARKGLAGARDVLPVGRGAPPRLVRGGRRSRRRGSSPRPWASFARPERGRPSSSSHP